MTSHPRRSVSVLVPGCNSPTPKAARVPVLVVLHSDGYVEVFGEHLDVHLVQALAAEQPEEVLADEYLDATLPRRFRDLHYPYNLVAAACCERRTAEDELYRRLALELVREARALWQERASA